MVRVRYFAIHGAADVDIIEEVGCSSRAWSVLVYSQFFVRLHHEAAEVDNIEDVGCSSGRLPALPIRSDMFI